MFSLISVWQQCKCWKGWICELLSGSFRRSTCWSINYNCYHRSLSKVEDIRWISCYSCCMLYLYLSRFVPTFSTHLLFCLPVRFIITYVLTSTGALTGLHLVLLWKEDLNATGMIQLWLCFLSLHQYTSVFAPLTPYYFLSSSFSCSYFYTSITTLCSLLPSFFLHFYLRTIPSTPSLLFQSCYAY